MNCSPTARRRPLKPLERAAGSLHLRYVFRGPSNCHPIWRRRSAGGTHCALHICKYCYVCTRTVLNERERRSSDLSAAQHTFAANGCNQSELDGSLSSILCVGRCSEASEGTEWVAPLRVRACCHKALATLAGARTFEQVLQGWHRLHHTHTHIDTRPTRHEGNCNRQQEVGTLY